MYRYRNPDPKKMKNVNPDSYSFLTGTVKYFGSAQEKNNSGFGDSTQFVPPPFFI
jgi:hypothetical protein